MGPVCSVSKSNCRVQTQHLVPLHCERIVQAAKARRRLLAVGWCTAGARQPAVCKVCKVAQRRLEDLPA